MKVTVGFTGNDMDLTRIWVTWMLIPVDEVLKW